MIFCFDFLKASKAKKSRDLKKYFWWNSRTSIRSIICQELSNDTNFLKMEWNFCKIWLNNFRKKVKTSMAGNSKTSFLSRAFRWYQLFKNRLKILQDMAKNFSEQKSNLWELITRKLVFVANFVVLYFRLRIKFSISYPNLEEIGTTFVYSINTPFNGNPIN